MMNNYLDILEDSLIKKSSILDELQTICDKQTTLLSASKISLEEFDESMDERDAHIEALTKLDDGFEVLFERVGAQLQENKDLYADQISRMQQLIQTIMDKSVSLQAQEKRNKEKISAYLQSEKKSVGESRRSSKAAYDYYKSMSGSNVIPPHFMDKKK